MTRHALLFILLLLAIALALAGFANEWTARANHPQRQYHPAGDLLTIRFAHADHQEQNCITCHHNFTDNTGSGLCLDCHKRHPEVGHLMQTQFHDLCQGCHLDQLQQYKAHGPTRACQACHQRDDAP